jgi:hypothetical protein
MEMHPAGIKSEIGASYKRLIMLPGAIRHPVHHPVEEGHTFRSSYRDRMAHRKVFEGARDG